MLVTEKLAVHAKQQPEKIITSFQGKNTSYSEFYEQVKRLAGYFQAKGYQKEDIIAVYLHNSDLFLVCYYACQLGGFTVLPVNTKLTAPEIDYILTHSEAKALIYDVRFNDVLNEIPNTFAKFQDTLLVGEEDTLTTIVNDEIDLAADHRHDREQCGRDREPPHRHGERSHRPGGDRPDQVATAPHQDERGAQSVEP